MYRKIGINFLCDLKKLELFIIFQNMTIKKRTLTNREKLWKQVNKRITKVVYTLNPNSRYLYDELPAPKQIDDTVLDDGYDEESFKWTTVISNIDWSGLVTEDEGERDIDEFENAQTENQPPPFNFDEFDIDDIAYDKIWN